MVTFRVFPGPILDIGDHLPPSVPSRTQTDICIPFVFNVPCHLSFPSLPNGKPPIPFPFTPLWTRSAPTDGYTPSLDFISRSVARSALCERTNCAFLRTNSFVCSTLAHFMGGGGVHLSNRVVCGHKEIDPVFSFSSPCDTLPPGSGEGSITTKPLRFCDIQWRTDQG
jgi:hypothetical protein